jgi:type IV secretory pathway VirB3-like protein
MKETQEYYTPIYQSLLYPDHTAGVPTGFFVVLMMSTIFFTAFFLVWAVPLIAVVAYLFVLACTRKDAQFFSVCQRKLNHKTFYSN